MEVTFTTDEPGTIDISRRFGKPNRDRMVATFWTFKIVEATSFTFGQEVHLQR